MLPTRVTLEQISVYMPDLQPGQLVTLLMAPHSGAAGRIHVRSSPECYGVQLLNGMLVDGVRREQMKLAPCDGGTGYPQLSGGGHTAPGCHGAPSICQPSATHLQDGAGSDTDEMESDAEGNPNGRSDTEGEGDEKSEDDGVEEEEPWDPGTASSSTSTGANGSHGEAAAAAAEDVDEEDADEDDANEEGEEEEEEEEAEEAEEAEEEERGEEAAQQLKPCSAKAATPGSAVRVVT